jgi:hypothetical protein
MTMKLPQPYTAISSDISNSTPGGYTRHTDLGKAAENAVTAAIRHDPSLELWCRSNRGDGEVTLAPGGVPSAWVLSIFLDRLRAEVLDYNRNKDAKHKLQLRIGIDCGDVLIDDDGVPRGGDPLVVAARLRECTAAREAVDAVPHAPIVSVISDTMYQRAVPHGALGLETRMFRKVAVQVANKPFAGIGWLYLPGHQPPVVGAAQADQPQRGPEPSSATTTREEDDGGRTGMSIDSIRVVGPAALGDNPRAVNKGGIHVGQIFQ